MLKNLFTVTVRSLLRNKFYSFINIFGLSVGIASCLLIWMYVENQLSYDRFHTHVDDIYRVIRVQGSDKNREYAGVTEAPTGPTMLADYPEVIDYVRVSEAGAMLVEYEDTKRTFDNCLMAGTSFFSMFTFPLVAGDPTTALSEPMHIAVTRSTAQSLFGSSTDAVGKTVYIREVPMTVSAVVENPPENSSIQFDLLISFITNKAMGRNLDTWRGDWLTTFLLLRPGTDPEVLNAQMGDFLGRYMPNRLEYGNKLIMHPFSESHLGSMHITFGGGISKKSDARYVYVFSAVAVFLVVIACINFMNLTTARSARRASEIGVRKVVGADRRQLIRQFLGESCALALLAFALAVGMVEWVAPRFAASFGVQLEAFDLFSLGNLPYAILFIAGTGLFAGLYPALYLSGFRPIQVLKDGTTPRSSGTVMRKVLVITQFTISAALIIGTGLVLKQFDFLRNRNLGFNTDQIMVINVPHPMSMADKLATLKNELLQSPNILSSTASNVTIGQNFIMGGGAYFEKEDGEVRGINTRMMSVDYDFLDTYGIELTSGRNFSKDHSDDTNSFEADSWQLPGAYIVNEEFARRYGFDDPVGHRLRMNNNGAFGEIVGVVKDFNFYTLHHGMEVLTIRLGPSDLYHRLGIKIASNDIRRTVAMIDRKWRETFDQPMAYTFQDDFFAKQYRREELTGTLVATFSGIAIVIACLGLVGLASYTSEQRTREIGIRKALGASISSVSVLLSSQFLKLILVANVIAWPIAYYAIRDWLADFAYRVEIGPLAFLEGALTVVIIALATVSYQAVKAAMTNPVEALKYE